LRLNKTIEAHFTDELDQCMALDFNFEEAETHTYTGIGELEYAAKYQQDKGSIDKLAELMPAIRERHPNFHRSDWIASIPGNPNKPFHLPGELVKRIAKERTTPVLALRKRKATPQLKSLPMAKKLETLENAFELGDNVDGCSVLLVDDLYQSGTTMWTLAKLLKQHGASDVYGLTCVKSWRDTDNQ
jgi:predicted amidophosphoribosyltransferase